MEKQKQSQKSSNRLPEHRQQPDRHRLLLTRRVNESIIIGNHVEITVVQLANNCVKLAVLAPAAVPVDRKEIRRKKNEKASERKRTTS
jgi:carbon storage regulator